MGTAFEDLAGRFDAWYDTTTGRALFDLEIACIQPLLSDLGDHRLEVGVGSGRFAAALGIQVGLDPVKAPLRLASGRGVAVVQGVGERLPFPDDTFSAVLLTTTLCFAADPAALLAEAGRVLQGDGRLVVGLIPADSAWGRRYQEQGRSGHPFYRLARFLTLEETERFLADAGFIIAKACSALTQPPERTFVGEEVHRGVVAGAGFVAIQAHVGQSSASGNISPKKVAPLVFRKAPA
ncbi:MAG: methyltransferase domain-containing protein [Actinobacteria bacterium]|nr:methyltransferase domain-containing protein [Actinomycetota bacterium]